MHHSPRLALILTKCRTRRRHGPYCEAYGNTAVLHISARLTATSVSAPELRELHPPALLTLTERCSVTDEELELIDMRYHQALALMNLEDLFADGQLDCISSV
jgi:hypothetical protein